MTAAPKENWDTPNILESEAGLCVHSTTRIAAPASLVFRVLRNTETWKDWNHFVPRVNITYQPPDEDLATAAEIEELVRNTSIAGSYDSDLTDGLVGGKQSKNKLDEKDRPQTPPLKLRMNSMASTGSGSDSGLVGGSPPNTVTPIVVPNGHGNGSSVPKMSAAQKYAAAEADRKASIAAGVPPPVVQNNVRPPPVENRGFTAYHTPPSAPSSRRGSKPEIDPTGRRKSKTPSLQKAMKARVASLNLLYGEPSVRLQLNTRMTFFIRMNPDNPREYQQNHFEVREVSRPDDPVVDGANVTQLTRSYTHTLNRMEKYRIVWGIDNTMSSLSNIKNGSAFPKSLLYTERVHDIRPITLGDGSEECELKTWELQKGPLTKIVKKKYEGYLQAQFEIWGKALGEHCEGMVGKVDRRDFSIIVDDDINAVGVITF